MTTAANAATQTYTVKDSIKDYITQNEMGPTCNKNTLPRGFIIHHIYPSITST
jgi:hypothetical protein